MTAQIPAPCIGHDDEHGNHHKCQRPDLSTRGRGAAGGRCAACVWKQREAAAKVRAYRELAPNSAVPLHPMHIRPTTTYAITCANCGTLLERADRDELAAGNGRVYSCDCGAAWQITAKTLSQVAA